VWRKYGELWFWTLVDIIGLIIESDELVDIVIIVTLSIVPIIEYK